MSSNGIATMGDVDAVEARGVAELPPCTYEMIRRGASIDPDAPALSFFRSVEDYRAPETWSYRDLVARITQTANFFHRLGATKDTVIAVVLPNLPETHFVIWGGQAAGIVVPLNPALEGAALAALVEAAAAEILVTLAPSAGVDLWEKIQPTLARLPSLEHVVLVSLADGATASVPEHVGVHDFADSIRDEDASALVSGRVFAPSDSSSWFCTGGTTGLPKLAMRHHGNEVANAWSLGEVLGDGIGPRKVVLRGLPLFHVNAGLVTGLLPSRAARSSCRDRTSSTDTAIPHRTAASGSTVATAGAGSTPGISDVATPTGTSGSPGGRRT